MNKTTEEVLHHLESVVCNYKEDRDAIDNSVELIKYQQESIIALKKQIIKLGGVA
jgi:hypothetical protein